MVDEQAELLCTLHDEHAPALWRYVVWLTGERHFAEDVVQETLVRAWRRPQVLDQSGHSARSWLFTVARNLVIDDRRSAHARHEIAAEQLSERVTDDGTDALLDAWLVSDALTTLSATDRREFERRLARWAACSAAVAELAGLPGLLARVPADEVETLIESPALPVPVTLLPRLVRSVARSRRRSRILVAGSIVAAAAAAVVLDQAVPGPLSADVSLVPEGWGTRLEMNCRYDATLSAPPGYREAEGAGYPKFVTDAAGRSMQVATWTASPGSTVEPSGTTSLAVADIRSIDIRSSVDGQVLLTGKP